MAYTSAPTSRIPTVEEDIEAIRDRTRAAYDSFDPDGPDVTLTVTQAALVYRLIFGDASRRGKS